MTDWVSKPLGGIIALQRGHDLPSQDRKEGGIPIMGSSGITGYHNEAKLNGPGVIVGRSGNSMGEVSFIDEDYWPLNTCLYVTDFKGNDERYIYYLLQTINFDQFNSGSAQKSLNRNAVYPYEVYITENKDEQIKIGRILADFEEKIELNRQTNLTLEQIAQAIFKSWFVDFDPVKAKIKSKQNGQAPELAAICAISGKTEEQLKGLDEATQQQLKTTAALFPDALVDSELGEVPEGWIVTDLKSVTTELRRGISPKYTEENGIQVINQKCIRNHSVNFELTRLNDPLKRKVDGRYVEVGDVLVNSTGVGTLGRLAPVRYLPEPTVFDSHVTVVRADKAEIGKSFLAGLMLTNEAFIEASGAGSTGQTELRKQVVEEIFFAKPPVTLGSVFDVIAEPMNNQIAVLEQQQRKLAQMRDTLLPKLLSGELTLDKPKTTTEAVAC